MLHRHVPLIIFLFKPVQFGKFKMLGNTGGSSVSVLQAALIVFCSVSFSSPSFLSAASQLTLSKLLRLKTAKIQNV